jgi:hypothetical protein
MPVIGRKLPQDDVWRCSREWLSMASTSILRINNDHLELLSNAYAIGIRWKRARCNESTVAELRTWLWLLPGMNSLVDWMQLGKGVWMYPNMHMGVDVNGIAERCYFQFFGSRDTSAEFALTKNIGLQQRSSAGGQALALGELEIASSRGSW